MPSWPVQLTVLVECNFPDCYAQSRMYANMWTLMRLFRR